MSILKNKIDFVTLVSVTMANGNGDPLNGNRPRADYAGYGEISDVCIKRKIRNRMQDMGYPIFVQSADRSEDGMNSLKERADAAMKRVKGNEEYAKKACETWMDVRTFGQVFAYGGNKQEDGKKKKGDGVSVGVRGPVSIHQAVSVSPVEIESMQITKSVNGEVELNEDGTEKNTEKSSDTMGMKHFVRFGLYQIKGSVNVQLAEKTGFTQEDAAVLKECLRTLFVNDVSSARPDGSMEVVKVFWWEHNCKDGQYSSAKVHRAVHVVPKSEEKVPESVEDYTIMVDELPGLAMEEIVGV